MSAVFLRCAVWHNQCERRPTVFTDEGSYCWQHDPARLAATHAAEQKLADLSHAVQDAISARERAERDLLAFTISFAWVNDHARMVKLIGDVLRARDIEASARAAYRQHRLNPTGGTNAKA